MKKIAMTFLLAISLVTLALAAEKSLGVSEYTSLGDLATAIASYFPKVQGLVTDVKGDQLTVALGVKDGLKFGVDLTLWRDGKQILHPVTGAVIGRVEEEVGEAEVLGVGEKTSTVVLLKKMKDPKPGDKARITPKKINIALLPLRVEQMDIVQGLAERLNGLNRFSVLENDKVTAFLKDRKQRDSSLIKEMGSAFGLDVVAAIEIYPSEKGKLLATIKMFYADDARPLDTITALLDLTKRESLGEVKPFFAPFKDSATPAVADKNSSDKLPFDAQLFAIADLDGSGALKYVFSDGMKLHIVRQDGSGWHEEWTEPGSFNAKESRIINLDVADINGNGRPEIIATAMRSEKVTSYVVEFQSGAYQRIAEVPGFLRVLKDPRKGNILIGQRYDPVKFFSGTPRQYAWSDGKYVPGAEYELPKGVSLYGFVVADLGEDQPLLVAQSNNGQLGVYAHGDSIWKGEEKYSTGSVTVAKPLTGIDAMTLKGAAEMDDKFYGIAPDKQRIPGRILALDVNGSGREEVVLPKNSGGILSGPKEAAIVGLRWTGARLDQRWNIKNISGIVRDIQVVKPQGGSARIYALVNIPGGLFRSDRIQVMSYTLK
jgi:hypothetical protein